MDSCRALRSSLMVSPAAVIGVGAHRVADILVA
jgi:hypothetical protein